MSSLRLWLRRRVGWSNSRQSWEERIGLAILLSGLALAIGYGGRLSLPGQVAIGAVLLLATAAVFRRGWVKLFGPVLFYDMVCVGRRGRFVLLRSLYLLGLLLILSWVYAMWSYAPRRSAGVRPQDLADLAEFFFFTFMIVQAVLVVILTPAYVAGAVAEEKERKTLEYLLATDLRNREIVLGKLVSRLANLTLLVLAGLPVLSATQFLGGVDPDLLLGAFAIIGLTMLSLASLSIFFSVRARRARDAIIQTYSVVFLYSALGLFALGLQSGLQYLLVKQGDWPEVFGPILERTEGIVNFFNDGNLLWLIVQLIRTLELGGNIANQLPGLLKDYAVFQGILASLCVGVAILSLRRVALTETEVSAPARPGRARGRSPVGEQPMWWKEIHIEGTIRLGWVGRSLLGLVIVCTFLPILIIFAESDLEFGGRAARHMNEEYIRPVGTAVACLLLLGVAVRAASCVSSERERQTLDALLTSPLSTSTILGAKWIGSILSVRWGWLWLGAIWLIGMVCGGLNPCAVPVLVVVWLIYAAAFAAVGQWFSVVCRSTLRATVCTLLSVLFLGGGHWLVTLMCCIMPLELARSGGHEIIRAIAEFEFGQTPPLVLGLLAFKYDDFEYSSGVLGELVFFSLVGLVCWMFGTGLLRMAIQARFEMLTGRSVRPSPDGEGVARNQAAD